MPNNSYEYERICCRQIGRMVYDDMYVSGSFLYSQGTRKFDLSPKYFTPEMTPEFTRKNAIHEENIAAKLVEFSALFASSGYW